MQLLRQHDHQTFTSTLSTSMLQLSLIPGLHTTRSISLLKHLFQLHALHSLAVNMYPQWHARITYTYNQSMHSEVVLKLHH